MRTRFITSAADPGGFPSVDLPEVAFVGRSNVGKSSLLNRLAMAKIARTSKTPGRTQLVNFFEVHAKESTFVLADLPGYGFAKAPPEVRAGFHELIEAYLERRGQPLRAVLQLVDARRDIHPDDREVHEWIRETLGDRIEIWVVLTKIDKLVKSKQKPALAAVGRGLGASASQVFGTSASTGQGIDALREQLLTMTAGGAERETTDR